MPARLLVSAVFAIIIGQALPAQQPAPAYTVVGAPENVPSAAAPRRYVVRLRIPYGQSRQDVRTLLEQVATEQRAKLNAAALMVFAYRPSDPVTGTYSAGRAIIAPQGDWARAGESGPLKTVVDLQDAYFAGDPARSTGMKKYLVSAGRSHTVSLSRRFESWNDADILAEVSTGTVVDILETRTSGPYVTRYRVRVKKNGKLIEGWVHASAVCRERIAS